MVATALLIALVSVAAVTDVVGHKIYNWTTYPGILAALVLNAVGDALVRWGHVDPKRREALSDIDLLGSLAGLALCGGILLVCFVLFRVGGGDVKLIAMIGAYLGAPRGLEAMLWTFVLGACAALIVLVWRVGPWWLARYGLGQLLWALRLGPPDPEMRSQLQPPMYLAPSALLAVVIVQFSLAQML
jgi:prepilin peptidase CpaA